MVCYIIFFFLVVVKECVISYDNVCVGGWEVNKFLKGLLFWLFFLFFKVEFLIELDIFYKVDDFSGFIGWCYVWIDEIVIFFGIIVDFDIVNKEFYSVILRERNFIC